MSNKRVKMSSRKAMLKLQEDLVKQSHFKKHEVDCLLKKYNACLSKPNTKLDRARFRDILHLEFQMTDDIIMDRVFKAFDKDNDGKISPEEWAKGMSVFLRGTLNERMLYCFDVYDMNSDGYISKEEMFHVLKHCLHNRGIEEDPDEGVKDIVDLLMKKLDIDSDGRIAWADFSTAVQKDPLLLECLGPCLPDQKAEMNFIANIEKEYGVN